MPKLYHAAVQIITDDKTDPIKLQEKIEKALSFLQISEVFVREQGEIEEELSGDTNIDNLLEDEDQNDTY